jgi:urease accessory protein
MEEDTKRMRGGRPYVFASLRQGSGGDTVARFIAQQGGLPDPDLAATSG